MSTPLSLPAVLAVIVAVAGFAVQPRVPDIVILNGRVFTGDPAQPWVEAIAITGPRISAVGTTASVRRSAAARTRLIDAAGRLLIPGINDAHTHVGAEPPSTRLEGPPAIEHDPTLDEVIARIRVAAAKAPPRGWVTGEIGGVTLDDPRANRTTLDPVTGDHPLLLTAWTGHGAIVNTAALRALDLSDTAPDPPGGAFLRGADGRTITGVAQEYAGYGLARRFAMMPSRSEQRRAFARYATDAASFGITSSQVMMSWYPASEGMGLLAGPPLSGRLRLIDFPLTAMPAWRPRADRPQPAASAMVSSSGTKWILDGTPVERLMYLRDPYADAPSTRGRPDFPESDLRTFLQRALEAREQPMLHAVGDGAIGAALDALEATGGERWKPLRPRIEHGDLFQRTDFERAKRMGVIIVQNPSHFMIPQYMIPRLGPERVERTLIVKSIVEAGVPFALGSDGPMNPYLNIMFATVNAVNPAEALTVEQALRAYTAGSASAEFAETEKGMVKTGMLADVALLSQDIFKVPPAALPGTVSVLTIVNGRVVYEARH